MKGFWKRLFMLVGFLPALILGVVWVLLISFGGLLMLPIGFFEWLFCGSTKLIESYHNKVVGDDDPHPFGFVALLDRFCTETKDDR